MATNIKPGTARKARDQRFEQLLALAREGCVEAVGDLWLEYGYEYGRCEA